VAPDMIHMPGSHLRYPLVALLPGGATCPLAGYRPASFTFVSLLFL